MPKPISYADAGVSIDNANRAVAKIREYARSTFNERTLTEIGSFGGMFSASFPQMAEPILVASADGVGTKLKLAFERKTNPGQSGAERKQRDQIGKQHADRHRPEAPELASGTIRIEARKFHLTNISVSTPHSHRMRECS